MKLVKLELNLKEVIIKINEYRREERLNNKKYLETEVSHTSHSKYLGMLKQMLTKRRTKLLGNRKISLRWKELENVLKKLDRHLYRLLDPVKCYLPSVLDRELAVVTAGEN